MIFIYLSMLSALLMTIMLWVVDKWDPATKLGMTVNEAFIYVITMTATAILVDMQFTNIIEKILATALLSVLLFCALTDSKTKFIYRFFNLILNGIAAVFLISHVIVTGMPKVNVLLLIASVVFYIVLLFGLHKFKTYGMGDVLSLSGNAMFLAAILPDKFFTIEILLWHYMIAVILLIICNITKFDFRKFKLKEEIAFAPEIYAGTFLLLAYFTLIYQA